MSQTSGHEVFKENLQSSSSRSRSSSLSVNSPRAHEPLDVIPEIFPESSATQARITPIIATLATVVSEEPQGDIAVPIQDFAVLIPLPSSPVLKKAKRVRPCKTSNSIPAAMPPIQPIPLLICSIGNPGAAYANTLHSAGHTALAALAGYISASSFQKDRAYANGLVSQATFSSAQPLWTLFQSPSYMNESGKPIAKAYASWARSLGPGAEGKVVILHDELEKPLGAVSVREGQGLSAKGHNGIKSLLQHMGKVGFVRVGLGIGRPVSREPNDVARFVLKKMTPLERDKVEGAAGEVLQKLRAVSGG